MTAEEETPSMIGQRGSPRILHLSWGRMEVEGIGAGKDFVLYPGGGQDWDWGVTGMSHTPGIRPVDVQDLIDRAPQAVVLSRGIEGRLQIDPATVEALEAAGIAVHQALTEQAVEIYNDLVATTAVAGLFHSTC